MGRGRGMGRWMVVLARVERPHIGPTVAGMLYMGAIRTAKIPTGAKGGKIGQNRPTLKIGQNQHPRLCGRLPRGALRRSDIRKGQS